MWTSLDFMFRLPRVVALSLRIVELLEDGFYKVVACPVAVRCTKHTGIIEYRFAGVQLAQTVAIADGVLHPVPDDGYHVAILRNVGFVVQSAVAGDHDG